MDDTRKEKGVPLVSEENCLQYFRSLHSNELVNPAQQTICNELGENERHGQEILNGNEILKAAKKVKNNKSPFSDKIRNEMIKASIDTLMLVYYKLFFSILRVGTMSRTRCGGLITPIYKAEDEVIQQTIVVFVSLASWQNCFVPSYTKDSSIILLF